MMCTLLYNIKRMHIFPPAIQSYGTVWQFAFHEHTLYTSFVYFSGYFECWWISKTNEKFIWKKSEPTYIKPINRLFWSWQHIWPHIQRRPWIVQKVFNSKSILFLLTRHVFMGFVKSFEKPHIVFSVTHSVQVENGVYGLWGMI